MKTKPKIELDIKKVEELASLGLTTEQIASHLGVSYSTLNRRIKELPEDEDPIRTGKAKGVAIVTNKLMELVKKGNLGAIIFYLKCKGGWEEKNNINVKTEQPIQITFKNDLTD